MWWWWSSHLDEICTRLLLQVVASYRKSVHTTSNTIRCMWTHGNQTISAAVTSRVSVLKSCVDWLGNWPLIVPIYMVDRTYIYGVAHWKCCYTHPLCNTLSSYVVVGAIEISRTNNGRLWSKIRLIWKLWTPYGPPSFALVGICSYIKKTKQG